MRPARMMFVLLPNGGDIASWPGSATAALADHTGQYSVMRNLCHRNAEALGDGAGDHAHSAACFLTGGAARGVKHAPVRTAAAGTPLCNLYLAMLQNMNVPTNRFGDSTQAIALNSIEPMTAEPG